MVCIVYTLIICIHWGKCHYSQREFISSYWWLESILLSLSSSYIMYEVLSKCSLAYGEIGEGTRGLEGENARGFPWHSPGKGTTRSKAKDAGGFSMGLHPHFWVEWCNDAHGPMLISGENLESVGGTTLCSNGLPVIFWILLWTWGMQNFTKTIPSRKKM